MEAEGNVPYDAWKLSFFAGTIGNVPYSVCRTFGSTSLQGIVRVGSSVPYALGMFCLYHDTF